MAIAGQMNNAVYFEADADKRAKLMQDLEMQTSAYGKLNGVQLIEVPDTLSKSEAAAIKAASHNWKASGILIVAAGPDVKVKGTFGIGGGKKKLADVTGIPDLQEIMPADLYMADTKHPNAQLDTSSRLTIVAADRLSTQAKEGGVMSAGDTNTRDDERTMGIPPEALSTDRRWAPKDRGDSMTARAMATKPVGPREH